VKRFLTFLTKLTPLRIAMVITLLVLAADLKEPQFLQTIDLKALDLKFRTRGIVKPSEQVALVVIDEKSVKELGRWPWPRWTHAKLVDQLKEAGAKAVAFDIVFSEADQNSELVKMQELIQTYKKMGLDMQPQFEALPPEYATEASSAVQPLLAASSRFYRTLVESEARANSDAFLAESISKSAENTVLGYFFYGEEVSKNELNELRESGFNDSLIQGSKVGLVSMLGQAPGGGLLDPKIDQRMTMQVVVPNIEVLSKATEHAGHFFMLPDPQDGTIRWNHLILKYKDDFYPSLGLKAASVALDKPIVVKVDHGLISSVSLGDILIPTDEMGRLLVNFAGPLADGPRTDITFKQYSFTDIINGRIPKEELADKIFIIGPTAVGIYDLRNTPFDPTYPGVGVHANVVSNIITQDFLQKPGWMKMFDFAIILAMGAFLGVMLGRLKGLQGALLTITCAVVYFLFTQYAFVEWGIWLSTVYPELEIVSVFAAIVTYKYMTEERQAKQIRGAFSSYVTPSVVDQVLREPDRLKLGGDTRELTVMFSDVRGFTTISERLTAEQLVDLLNAYLSKMTDLVFKSDGTLDKYIGDALMAIWGAPVEQPDHATRACYTAIEMLEVLEKELRPQWDREGLKHIPAGQIPEVDIGIGLNTGEMVVGNMGSDQRFDYTVMGDNVNLGSRLEGTNKAYGTHIIISEFTRKAAGDSIVVRELDLIRVKGKNEPVRIYELVGKAGQVSAETLEKIRLFEEGLQFYRAREWDMAEKTWRDLLAKFPTDETTEIFLERVADNREAEIPENWDGVYVMKTK
jgi:adenylate cyclase